MDNPGLPLALPLTVGFLVVEELEPNYRLGFEPNRAGLLLELRLVVLRLADIPGLRLDTSTAHKDCLLLGILS